tara:strand:- start:56 stop:436 length:381 start_codon:yes stop_codon:yes gene_type:complete
MSDQHDVVKYQSRDSNCDEMEHLLEDFYELQELQHSMNVLLYGQRGKLDRIMEHMDSADIQIEGGIEELVEAKKYAFRYTPILVGTTLGMMTMGPLGWWVGFKFGGLVSSASGGLLGGWLGYKVQK